MVQQNKKLSTRGFADFLPKDYRVCVSDAARCAETPIRVLSLFSGCGGMDIGFEGSFICNRKSVPANSSWIEKEICENWVLLRKNRFETVFANDILREAETAWWAYMSRHHEKKNLYHQQSIVELVKSYEQGNYIFPSDIDVVTGGFPCQDFSLAGKRAGFDSAKMHDGTVRDVDTPSEETRGKLYYWMKRVIDITKPKMFIAENVKGLVNLGNAKEIIQRDFSSADGNEYIVLPPRVLNACNYGAPENRERVIFIGLRKSALRPEVEKAFLLDKIPAELNPYPGHTHGKSSNESDSLMPFVLCEDVLKDLLEPEESMDISQKFYSKAKYQGKHCQGQIEIQLCGLSPTIRSEHHGNIEYRRLSQEHGGILIDELKAGLKERRLTPRECALIQTFPPDYPFIRRKENSKRFNLSPSSAYKVIGNAVPPILAYNIARRIQSIWDDLFY